MRRDKSKGFLIIFLYTIVIFAVYWSLLLGNNLMKWDIYDGHMPMQLLFSGAIKNGELMLWNPLLNFGTPYYASVGTPVWYWETFLLNILGYKPYFISIEYCIHVLIGAIGMYMLTYYNLEKSSINLSRYATAFSAGMLYCFSGVFLSNAEHIMIIISASWTPYVFYFSEKAIKENKARIINLMLAGMCSGFIILGGYPEVFYNLYLILFFWIVYWSIHKKIRLLGGILDAIKTYVSIILLTLFSSAITVIPFIKLKNLITRGGGQNPISYPLSALLSTFLPMTIDEINGYEISMGLFYIGIITIVLIMTMHNVNAFYVALAAISLLLCFGRNSFIHSLLYRFFPMYSTFRFPTTWRIFFSMFGILSVSGTMLGVYDDKCNSRLGVLLKRLSLFAALCAIITYIISVLAVENSTAMAASKLSEACFMMMIVLLGYFFVNAFFLRKEFDLRYFVVIFTGMIVLECLIVTYKVMPYTISAYTATDYMINEEVKRFVDDDLNRSLNYSNDFSYSGRGTNGLNSNMIVDLKDFDEEGYVSIKLAKTEAYKNTYNRSIIQQNPEMFFTNDIVDSNDVSLQNWLMQPNTPPYQVYVDEKSDIYGDEIVVPDFELISETPLELVELDENVGCIIGNFVTNPLTASKVRLYFSGNNPTAYIDTYFQKGSEAYDVQTAYSEDEHYGANYSLYASAYGESYVDISLPQTDIMYSRISFRTDDPVSRVTFVELGRDSKDTCISIEQFHNNLIKANVKCPSDGMIVLLQANYNGWKVKIDGVRTDIKEVDGTFIGIPVTEGEHKIELLFDPVDFKIGATITTIFYIVLVMMLVFNVRSKMKTTRANDHLAELDTSA